MTTPGWILMIASNAFVLGLIVFCYGRVLAKRPRGTDDPGDGP